MFKVVIIDDEPIIRKGIKNVINWKQLGCEVCGEADDGQSGRELIENFLPDIIITDIKMPEVDGLTMINTIKCLIPDSKIIILTGYRNFDYVQTAIKLGAFDFIMKPSKIEELNAVLNRAVAELNEKSKNRFELDTLKEQFEKSKPLVRERLLYNLLYGLYTNETDILAEAARLSLHFDNYLLGIVESEISSSTDESHLYQFGIINTFEEVFSENYEIAFIPLGNRMIAFLLTFTGDGVHDFEKINGKCIYLQNIIQNCFEFTVSIAFSSVGLSYSELPEKLRECKEALEHKFYLGTNSVIFYNDLHTFFKFNDPSNLYNLQKQMVENIKAGNIDGLKENIASIQETINSECCTDKDYIRNFYFNNISLINSIQTSLPHEDDQKKHAETNLVELYSLIEKCDNIGDLNEILGEIALRAVSKVHEYNDNNMKLLIRKAVDYINEHYKEDVTLNKVADHIYVSSFYISRMFKKEIGINFVDYLNDLRINKAKELLQDISYKTYEVAEAVGIANSHYFSKLFKKHVGVTPSEYRESLKPI
jgi:two-component system response regulator YesN